MFLSVDSFLGKYYDVIDKKTNKKIPLVQWADDELGIYEVLIQDEKEELEEHFDSINEEWVSDKKILKGEIELVGKNLFFKLLKKITNPLHSLAF